MGFYQDRVLPGLIHFGMSRRDFIAYRDRVVAAAEGRVLEIGIGSGLNLPFYKTAANEIVGLDPSAKLLEIARKSPVGVCVPVTLIEGSAEAIPFDDASFDTVLTTWTLCSIPNASSALKEMLRVLQPSGRLLFVEHGLAPEKRVRWWQDHLTPVSRCLCAGCHLNRPIADLIQTAGFRMEQMETGYMHGPNPTAFMYEGSARPPLTAGNG